MTPEEAFAKLHDYAENNLIGGYGVDSSGDFGAGVTFWDGLRILRMATRVDPVQNPSNWYGEYWSADGTAAISGQSVRLLFTLDERGIHVMSARPATADWRPVSNA